MKVRFDSHLFGIRRTSLILFCCIVLPSCSGKKNAPSKDYIVIAVEGDVDSFNPLFAQEATAGDITDLLFPGLVDSKFDTVTGKLQYFPLIAKTWESGNEGKDIIFHLQTYAKWTDGSPVTSHD